MIKKVDPSILEDLATYDSATVQNAAILVRGYVPAGDDYTGPDLQQYVPGSAFATVGYAVTSVWAPITQAAKVVADRNVFFDTIAEVGAPVIVVLKDSDPCARRGAIIGDGMATIMRALGAVGAVLDGNARDIPGIAEAGLALWATGTVPGHGPFDLLSYGDPVEAAELKIANGDILVCDQDGTTRVPVEIAAQVAKACAEVREKEAAYRAIFTAEDFSPENWRKNR
jgi:regulator of RNase E activity RraA